MRIHLRTTSLFFNYLCTFFIDNRYKTILFSLFINFLAFNMSTRFLCNHLKRFFIDSWMEGNSLHLFLEFLLSSLIMHFFLHLFIVFNSINEILGILNFSHKQTLNNKLFTYELSWGLNFGSYLFDNFFIICSFSVITSFILSTNGFVIDFFDF